MIQDYTQFLFSEKGLGLVFPPHFVFDLSRKMFRMLYSINWLNFIVWLHLLLKILDNMCIVIVWFLYCDVANFEINLSFPIKLSFYMTKNLRTKTRISQERIELFGWNKKHFWSFLEDFYLSEIVSYLRMRR